MGKCGCAVQFLWTAQEFTAHACTDERQIHSDMRSDKEVRAWGRWLLKWPGICFHSLYIISIFRIHSCSHTPAMIILCVNRFGCVKSTTHVIRCGTQIVILRSGIRSVLWSSLRRGCHALSMSRIRFQMCCTHCANVCLYKNEMLSRHTLIPSLDFLFHCWSPILILLLLLILILILLLLIWILLQLLLLILLLLPFLLLSISIKKWNCVVCTERIRKRRRSCGHSTKNVLTKHGRTELLQGCVARVIPYALHHVQCIIT